MVDWLQQLSDLQDLRWVVPAHYAAPVACSSDQLKQLAMELEQRCWAPSEGNWTYLASIDQALLRLGVVPEKPAQG